METNSIQVRDSFVVNALRNCGYNNYAAIADIIDNSIEPEVNASRVEITLETQQRVEPISTIIIADNGSGMSYDTLKEAMCLGAQTGKTGESNLGMYGTGLKTAALSIGKTLTVKTLTDGSDTGSIAVLDINDSVINDGHIKVAIDTIPATEILPLLPENSTRGTVVTISSIDRLTNRDRKAFGQHLREELGEIFAKFILKKVCKFFVDRKEVEPTNLMMNSNGANEILAKGKFTITKDNTDHNFIYTAYYIPKDGSENSTGDGPKRNERTQGFYIYRQNRLVGKGLSLGIFKKHPRFNALRIELLMDGTNDELLGSTFTKIVTERSAQTMSQALFDKLAMLLGPSIKEVERRSLLEAKNSRTPTDPETLKMYSNVADAQNRNLLLKINRRGENKPSTGPKEHSNRGPQTHPPVFRERRNKWLDGFQETPLGPGECMFRLTLSNNKTVVIINTDHPFYTEFYKELPIELKYKMAQVISCHQIAKTNINYYGSEEVANIVDTYNDILSVEVSKSLKN